MKEFREKGAKCFTIFRVSDNLNMGRVYAQDEDAARFSADWFFSMLFKVIVKPETRESKRKRVTARIYRPTSF